MTIVAYVGLPGHGKSYGVVENVLIPALKENRTVVHNLTLKLPELGVVTDQKGKLVQLPADVESKDFPIIARQHPGAVWILDEIWKWYGAGLKVSDIPPEEVGFFKEHRHSVGADGKASEIAIIDQALGSGVSKFIRDVVELTYIHTKLTDLGFKRRFRVDVYSKAQNADKPRRDAHVRTLSGVYKPEIFNCYVSHTKNQGNFGQGVLEVMPDSRGNIWKSWQVRLAIAAIPLIALCVWALTRTFHKMGGSENPGTPQRQRAEPVKTMTVDSSGVMTITSERPAASSNSSRSTPSAQTATKESKRWRYAGTMKVAGREVAILDSDRGARYALVTACHKDDAGNPICTVDGELVAAWTGPDVVAPPAALSVGNILPGLSTAAAP